MDCNDYRQTVAADPAAVPAAAEAHAISCAGCAAWRDEMQALDARIARALKIRVPELQLPELPAPDDANVAVLAGRRSRAAGRTPVWLALAATVAFAAVLGYRVLDKDVSGQTLADQVLAHVDHEPYALRVSDRAVDPERLARVLPANSATLADNAGLITYAQSCVINGHEVPHLVIQGRNGPVTILLMPEETIDEAQTFDGTSVNGVILPVGSGSIAIIGESGEDLEAVRQSVVHSVSWST